MMHCYPKDQFKFIFIGLLLLCSFIACKKEDSSFRQAAIQFLNNQHQVLDLSNSNTSSFDLMKEDMENHQFFFTGESHAVAANFDLEFELFKYLYTNANVRNYVMENSYSNVIMLNQYLTTGNLSILESLYNSYRGSFSWNRNGFDFWKKMYEFLQDIPKEDWPLFVGIDIEHQTRNTIDMLQSFLPNETPPSTISNAINELRDESEGNSGAMWQLGLVLSRSLASDEADYQTYLGDQFFDFSFIVQNIQKHQQVKQADDKASFEVRDQAIYENFLLYHPKFKPGKYFGQWGSRHVIQGNIKGGDSFSHLLQHEAQSPLLGEVLSIIYLYQGCQYMSNGNYQNAKLADFRSHEILEQYIKPQKNTLFKLTGSTSPYESNIIWNLNYPNPEPQEGVTTDYYQYVIVVEGSAAAVKYQ